MRWDRAGLPAFISISLACMLAVGCGEKGAPEERDFEVSPWRETGAVAPVVSPGGARRIRLRLALPPDAAFDQYAVVITRDGEFFWEEGGARKAGMTHLEVKIPTARLTAGQYRAAVRVGGGDGGETVASYRFTIAGS